MLANCERRPPLTETDAKMILETWHLCHDLLVDHIKRVCTEPDTRL
jgi:hypothetical protein